MDFPIVLTKWMILYVVVAVGITELLMRDEVTSKHFDKARWGALATFAVGMVVGFVGSLREGHGLVAGLWRGLITVGLSTLLYDVVKGGFNISKGKGNDNDAIS